MSVLPYFRGVSYENTSLSLVAAALALSAAPPRRPGPGPWCGAQVPGDGAPGGVTLTPARGGLLPKAIDAPDIKYEVVKDFMKLPPNVYMGEGIGVARNSKGHIFVNTCAQQTRNFEFDPNGNFVREIGKDSYGNVFCHGIRVDAQDNIWVIDEGSNSIIKFNPRRPRGHDHGPPDWVPLYRDGARR